MISRPETAGWRKCLLLLLLGLSLAFPVFAQAPPSQAPTPVIAARAELARWSDPLDALGTLKADESVTLSAKVTETIESLEFEGGERVEAGDVLVRLDDDEAQANLRAAEALRDERQAAVNRLAQLQQRNLRPSRCRGQPRPASPGSGGARVLAGPARQLPDQSAFLGRGRFSRYQHRHPGLAGR